MRHGKCCTVLHYILCIVACLLTKPVDNDYVQPRTYTQSSDGVLSSLDDNGGVAKGGRANVASRSYGVEIDMGVTGGPAGVEYTAADEAAVQLPSREDIPGGYELGREWDKDSTIDETIYVHSEANTHGKEREDELKSDLVFVRRYSQDLKVCFRVDIPFSWLGTEQKSFARKTLSVSPADVQTKRRKGKNGAFMMSCSEQERKIWESDDKNDDFGAV